MSAIVQDRKLSGPGAFSLTLLLITPSVVAFFASSALAHEARFPASALWFIYEISLYVGCLGVGVAAALTVIEAIRRQISPVFPCLMGISVIVGISLLWYARHIFRTPWYSGS
ncbi:MAG TPA: hypothetical protein VN742_10335 [Candidatus Binataceae bacterium]|jgi:hypothetical protein|nr:hypothetical protein [Candidatus Binataceae bacterium]